MDEEYILILYYSRQGGTAKLAEHIATGVEQAGITARIRTVPAVSPDTEQSADEIPEAGPMYCTQEDLAQCSGLLLGSPTRFGNMAAPLRYFWDQTSPIWLSGQLVSKPAGVFVSTSTLHGGQESTLLSMMLPLIHHGMLITGIPFTEADMHDRTSSASPYGATHLATSDKSSATSISQQEARLARSLGQRVAQIAINLRNTHV